MELSKQEKLEEFEGRLLAEIHEARAILDIFRRAELLLTRIEPADGGGGPPGGGIRTWLLYWQPPEHLRVRFDFAPELLMVLVPWREAQARAIEAAEQALQRDFRLDRALVFLVARDETASTRLAQPIGHTGRLYIPMSFAQVNEVRDPQAWLRALLLDRIGSGDLFAAGRPVVGWDFVGRDHDLRVVRGRLLDGRPIGLYGIRKVGKTSFMIRLREKLLEDAGASIGHVSSIPIHVDLLGISFAELNRAGFLRSLARAMIDALDRLRLVPGQLGLPRTLSDIGRLRKLSPQELDRHVPEALECMIDWARRRPEGTTVLLFLDEYELLLNGRSFPQDEGLGIFDYLRGQVQINPRTFNFLIAGINRHLAATPRFGDRQNPLFNFMIEYPMSGLTRAEVNELFRKIGRRLALRFEPDALDAIWEETGGHPYLARELGRAIDRAVSPQERNPKPIHRSLVLKHREAYRRAIAPTMQEIHAMVADLAPLAPEVLRYMVEFPEEVEESMHALRPEVVDTLRSYGILSSDGESGPPVRIGCFAAWLRENEPVGHVTAATG